MASASGNLVQVCVGTRTASPAWAAWATTRPAFLDYLPCVGARSCGRCVGELPTDLVPSRACAPRSVALHTAGSNSVWPCPAACRTASADGVLRFCVCCLPVCASPCRARAIPTCLAEGRTKGLLCQRAQLHPLAPHGRNPRFSSASPQSPLPLAPRDMWPRPLRESRGMAARAPAARLAESEQRAPTRCCASSEQMTHLPPMLCVI